MGAEVIVHHSIDGPVEVARHERARHGTPRIDDTHFSDSYGVKVPGDYTIKARSVEEAEFLGIGHGAAAGRNLLVGEIVATDEEDEL